MAVNCDLEVPQPLMSFFTMQVKKKGFLFKYLLHHLVMHQVHGLEASILDSFIEKSSDKLIIYSSGVFPYL